MVKMKIGFLMMAAIRDIHVTSRAEPNAEAPVYSIN
jgi:hypothetical protein